MNVNIANAANPGLTIGNAILVNVLSSPQPSIFADSNNSPGIFSLNCFIKNTPKGHPIKGRITAAKVSCIPKKFIILTKGTNTTCFGNAIAAIKTENTNF